MKIETFLPSDEIAATMKDLPVVSDIIVHHTASGPNTTVQDIYQWHVVDRAKEGFKWIGYHFVIYIDGTIYQTRPLNKMGAHCWQNGYNRKSLGIALVGNFETDKPTREQWHSLSNLVHKLQRDFPALKDRKLLTHKEASGGATLCPGKHMIELLKTPLFPEELEEVHEPLSLEKFSTVELLEEVTKRIQK